jgi:hypothetical protein
MASTYSDLKIELISTGEQSGTWGSTTNTNLGTALEEAIVGLANVDFPSDADLTLALTNTNTSQVARHLVLSVTSAVSLTQTRALIVPDIEKPYIISNTTTGNRSIQVKNSTGPSVSIPNGKETYVYSTGVGVISVIDYLPALDTGALTTASLSTDSLTTTSITSDTVNATTFTSDTAALSTPLPVSSGGTGVASLTANNVLLGNGASSPLTVAPGTSGNVLTSDGTTWGSSAIPATPIASTAAAIAGTNNTDFITPLRMREGFNASGNPPVYACRAWVSFNGTNTDNVSGTYSQSGTTVTLTVTGHGLLTGHSAYIDFTTGSSVDGVYVVTVIDANTFTVQQASRTTGGAATLVRATIRSSGNVSTVARSAEGRYIINFTVAMPDANYCVSAASIVTGGSRAGVFVGPQATNADPADPNDSYSVNSIAIGCARGSNDTSGGGYVNANNINVSIFR